MVNMRVILKIIKNMEQVPIHGKMVINTMVYSKMTIKLQGSIPTKMGLLFQASF